MNTTWKVYVEGFFTGRFYDVESGRTYRKTAQTMAELRRYFARSVIGCHPNDIQFIHC